MDFSQLNFIPIMEKIFSIISSLVYIIFSFVIVRQVDSMSHIVITQNNSIIKNIAKLNLIISIILFVIILIIL